MSNAPLVRTISAFPWMTEEALPLSSSYGRRSVIVSGEIEEVTTSVCDDPLPEVGQWLDAGGRKWKRFELPCADWQAARSSDVAELSLVASHRPTQQLVVTLAPALPRPSVDLQMEDLGRKAEGEPALPRASDALSKKGLLTEQITDTHVEYVNDLFDHQWPHRHYWEENVGGIALRSLKRSLARWRRSGARDEARLALIVKLAEKLPRVLEDICQRPRVVLRRVREMLSVGRIQEVDAGCLRWLARQPGRSIVEKAGTRQQVLGITRIEDADTPENRVVRDFLIRAVTECRRYLSDNRQFPDHPRVLTVRSFQSQLRRFLTDSPVGTVSPLVGEAQPNYVLQHEPRYAVLWEAYLLLVHQQKQQENIWRWRERTWGEVCSLVIWNTMRLLGGRGPALRSDIFCRDEQLAGRFLDIRSAAGGWESERGGAGTTIDVVEGAMLARHPLIPQQLHPLCPDCIIVSRQKGSTALARPLIAVWTLLEANLRDDGFVTALDTLNGRLQQCTATSDVFGLILTPYSGITPANGDKRSHVEVIQLSMPFSGVDAVAQTIRRKWGLA